MLHLPAFVTRRKVFSDHLNSIPTPIPTLILPICFTGIAQLFSNYTFPICFTGIAYCLLVFLLLPLQLSTSNPTFSAKLPGTWLVCNKRKLNQVKIFKVSSRRLHIPNTTVLWCMASHSFLKLNIPKLEIHVPLLAFPFCS